jgi:solute carrier family 26 (sodium-independent sulfate anion transporter), member 11
MFFHLEKWRHANVFIPSKSHDTNPSRRTNKAESITSVSTADGYTEYEPTVAEFIREITPTGRQVLNYIKALFPFISWLPHYNLQWLVGDLIAGNLTL